MNRFSSLLGKLFSADSKTPLHSPRAYTQEFARAVKLADPFARVEVQSDLVLKMTNSAGLTCTSLLENSYASYTRQPGELRSIIEAEIQTILSANTAGLDRRRIVPVIKSRRWLAEASKTAFDYVMEDLNDELVVIYVEDLRRNIRYLSWEQLSAVGIERKEVRPLALENLMRLLPQIELHKGPVVSMLTAGGNYEASLLLVKDFWSGGKVQVAGEIVVAVPSRDVVLITGSANAQGMVQIKALAARSVPAKASYQLTNTLFVYRNGQFCPFS